MPVIVQAFPQIGIFIVIGITNDLFSWAVSSTQVEAVLGPHAPLHRTLGHSRTAAGAISGPPGM